MADDMKWYVIHTYSGMEKSAESALRERIKRAGLEDTFGEILLRLKMSLKSATVKSVFPHVACTPAIFSST